MKFMCLAYEDEQIFHDMAKSDWLALRQETLDYVDHLRSHGKLIDTLPLRSATTATTVRVREGRVRVTDGPFTETKEQIGGYFLIEAEDLEEATQIAARWPSARLGIIEVRPVEEELRNEGRYVRAPR